MIHSLDHILSRYVPFISVEQRIRQSTHTCVKTRIRLMFLDGFQNEKDSVCGPPVGFLGTMSRRMRTKTLNQLLLLCVGEKER
uniref:Uncharacterized protein n=1 Tax=Anopheles funestus TaxID=62324 RepID=A0A182S3Z4_ANOFN